MQNQRQAMVELQSPLAHVHIHLTSLLDKGDFSVTTHVQTGRAEDAALLNPAIGENTIIADDPGRQTDRGHEEKRTMQATKGKAEKT